MKPIFIALCIFTLIPVGASAEGNSPRMLCLEKADQQTERILKSMSRLEALQRQGVPVMAAASAYVTVLRRDYHGSGYELDSSQFVRTERVLIPSEYVLLRRELARVENRRSQCASLSDVEERISARRAFHRGGKP